LYHKVDIVLYIVNS